MEISHLFAFMKGTLDISLLDIIGFYFDFITDKGMWKIYLQGNESMFFCQSVLALSLNLDISSSEILWQTRMTLMMVYKYKFEVFVNIFQSF